MKKILMCRPKYFSVDYVINPWMNDGLGLVDKETAINQWTMLREVLLDLGCSVSIIENQKKGLPDLVFTANAGFVMGEDVLISSFKCKERKPESEIYSDWFSKNGFNVDSSFLNEGISFEGAGDALIDYEKGVVFLSYGFRTDKDAVHYLSDFVSKVGFSVVQLELINPSFYHLDTCFCPLAGGFSLFYEKAFSQESKDILKKFYGTRGISVGFEDAKKFACNAVNIDKFIVMNAANEELFGLLEGKGFFPIFVPLSEYMLSGGSAKCLTLEIG